MKNTSETCHKTTNANETDKATIKLAGEFEATGKVNDVYEDINTYKAMANNPNYLEISWGKIKNIMRKEGKLGKKTKDIIALIKDIDFSRRKIAALF